MQQQGKYCPDCQHAIIESGLATRLLAEKSPTLRADIMMQMTLLIEDDERITPARSV